MSKKIKPRRVVSKHAQHTVGTRSAKQQPNAFFNPGSRRGTMNALLYQQGQFGKGK